MVVGHAEASVSVDPTAIPRVRVSITDSGATSEWDVG